jgi:hypothetical protein
MLPVDRFLSRTPVLLNVFLLSIAISACDRSHSGQPPALQADDSPSKYSEPGNSKLASLIQQCGEVYSTWKDHIEAVAQSLERYGAVHEIEILTGAVGQLSDLQFKMNQLDPDSDLESQKVAISDCDRALSSACAELDLVDEWVLKNIGDSYQSRKLEQVRSRIDKVRRELFSNK